MNYLRSYLNTSETDEAAGTSGAKNADTVERLIERYETSTLAEDRRDAVRALKSLSKKCRFTVGSRAMAILVDVIKHESVNTELLNYALDALVNVIAGDYDEDSVANDVSEQEFQEMGDRFTEILTKDVENVEAILALLAEYEFQIRWPTVRLLTAMLKHQTRHMQDLILRQPTAISSIMDLLVDQREVVRNDALLLLNELCKGNASLQKIVAYESAFERLLDIVLMEGGDSIVVEDSLCVILYLLKNNSSNQQLFKENSMIQRMTPLFIIGNSVETDDEFNPEDGQDIVWTAQRVANMHLLFQVVRTLVNPLNSANSVAGCQKTMLQCGLLKELCQMLLSDGNPADVLAECINTIAEMIRGNGTSQGYFGAIMAPANPPKPIIVILLMSMTNDKQPFSLRCAVLYCVQCYLYRNDHAKQCTVQTLLPQSVELSGVTTGHLLVSGLVSADVASVWFCSVALAHCLVDMTSQKEQMLKVQLATSMGNPPTSLLEQCCQLLTQSSKVQIRIGLLILLCSWFAQCPLAVGQFLSATDNVPFLTAEISASEGDDLEAVVHGLCALLLGICYCYNDETVPNYSKEALEQLIRRRLKVELFIEKLQSVSKNESYMRVAQKPQLKFKSSNELIFDHQFTKLYKDLEAKLCSIFKLPEDTNNNVPAPSPMSPNSTGEQQQNTNVISHYKELIKEQDSELVKLKVEIDGLKGEILGLQSQKHVAAAVACSSNDVNSSDESRREIERLSDELRQKCQIIDEQNQKLAGQLSADQTNKSSNSVEIEALKVELANLQVLSQHRESECLWYRQYCDQMRDWFTNQHAATDSHLAMQNFQTQIGDLETQLYHGWKAYETLNNQFSALNLEKTESEQKCEALATQIADSENRTVQLSESYRELENRFIALSSEKSMNVEGLKTEIEQAKLDAKSAVDEKRKIVDEFEKLKHEQDDLLVLLADQDAKLCTYRRQLKQAGITVDDDSDNEIENTEKQNGYGEQNGNVSSPPQPTVGYNEASLYQPASQLF